MLHLEPEAIIPSKIISTLFYGSILAINRFNENSATSYSTKISKILMPTFQLTLKKLNIRGEFSQFTLQTIHLVYNQWYSGQHKTYYEATSITKLKMSSTTFFPDPPDSNSNKK